MHYKRSRRSSWTSSSVVCTLDETVHGWSFHDVVGATYRPQEELLLSMKHHCASCNSELEWRADCVFGLRSLADFRQRHWGWRGKQERRKEELIQGRRVIPTPKTGHSVLPSSLEWYWELSRGQPALRHPACRACMAFWVTFRRLHLLFPLQPHHWTYL